MNKELSVLPERSDGSAIWSMAIKRSAPQVFRLKG
jgi:hypothetical protein